MENEFVFYPTKGISKNKFAKNKKDNIVPIDLANKEQNKKDKQYFCFKKNKKKSKKANKILEEESEKNNLLNDDIYLFNQRMKQVKSIRTLKREEIIKPYNYQIEYDMNEEGILDKKSNKEKVKYDFLDMFPNGEGYKFINDDEEESKHEEKKIIKLPTKKIDEQKIKLIEKNDENNIANIINKELKENGLLENNKKIENNANDF